MDNGDAGTSFTGLWAVSAGANPYGKDSLYSRETATYTWHADLPQAGAYEVYMWWTEYPSPLRQCAGDDPVRQRVGHGAGESADERGAVELPGDVQLRCGEGGTVTLTAGMPIQTASARMR
ncbi:MAG: hypothetical protein U0411_06275 [Thermodesulfovibrionales bacterium]